jgi:glyoxylase I family protein
LGRGVRSAVLCDARDMASSALAGLRHVDLCVSDLKCSLEFYCELLDKLGWDVTPPHLEISGEQGERVIYLFSSSDPGQGALGLRAARENTPVDRYRVGLHHLAFNAASREQVDEVWDWVKASNLEHEGPPRDYYNVPYYAVFFRDPDAIKLEVVHRRHPAVD